MDKQWIFVKVNWKGITFEEVGGEDTILVDSRILGMGMAIYGDVEYDHDELEDYIIEE